MMKSRCRVCNVELDDENWYPSQRYGEKRSYICKKCVLEHSRLWRGDNCEKVREQGIRAIRKKGIVPMSENRGCSAFLGVHVAERVLSSVFKNVERTPYGNSGYDFICNHGKKIDVKSSCLRKDGRWLFNLKKNTIADHFLCIAFDDRDSLNPLHVWLLPSNIFGTMRSVSIKPSTIDIWDEHRLNIDDVIKYCNIIRS